MKPALAVCAGLALLLTACTVTSTPTAPVTTSSSSTPSPTPSPTPSAIPTVLPTETILPQNAQKYMLMLEDAVPELTNDELYAIELGQGVCTRRDFGWSEQDIRAWIQFVTGQHSFASPLSLSDDQANRVLAAASGYLC